MLYCFRICPRRVQANQVHISFWFMLVISVLSGSTHTLKKNREALEFAKNNIGLAVNAEKVT
jgi:hypothetical protein